MPRDELEKSEKKYYDQILALVKSIPETKAAAEKFNNPRLLDGIPMMEKDLASKKRMWSATRSAQDKSTAFPAEFAIK